MYSDAPGAIGLTMCCWALLPCHLSSLSLPIIHTMSQYLKQITNQLKAIYIYNACTQGGPCHVVGPRYPVVHPLVFLQYLKQIKNKLDIEKKKKQCTWGSNNMQCVIGALFYWIYFSFYKLGIIMASITVPFHSVHPSTVSGLVYVAKISHLSLVPSSYG